MLRDVPLRTAHALVFPERELSQLIDKLKPLMSFDRRYSIPDCATDRLRVETVHQYSGRMPRQPHAGNRAWSRDTNLKVVPGFFARKSNSKREPRKVIVRIR